MLLLQDMIYLSMPAKNLVQIQSISIKKAFMFPRKIDVSSCQLGFGSKCSLGGACKPQHGQPGGLSMPPPSHGHAPGAHGKGVCHAPRATGGGYRLHRRWRWLWRRPPPADHVPTTVFWARFRGGDSYILVCFQATSLCSRDGFGGT